MRVALLSTRLIKITRPFRTITVNTKWNPTLPSLRFNGIRWLAGLGSPRRSIHSGERLAAPILKNSPQLIMASASKHEEREQLTKDIYENLKIKEPEQLRAHYDSSESYYEAHASLVVEETRYTIADALANRFDPKVSNEKAPSRPVEIACGPLPPKLKNSPNTLVEFWSTKPFHARNRDDFRAGTVVAFLRRGHSVPENLILGTIHLGSRRTTPLPDRIQDELRKREKDKEEKQKKKKKNKNGKGKKEAKSDKKKKAKSFDGERMTALIFTDVDNSMYAEGEFMEVVPLVSILNYMRQFAGCTLASRGQTFGGNLYQSLEQPKESDAGVSIDEDENLKENEPPSDEEPSYDTWSSILVPDLNHSQDTAATDFLNAEENRICIVQGPPGTGKTTMTVSTICRYILKTREKGRPRKLLVCGPTNKSVVVLARKVLKCVKHDDTIRARLIGDQSEMLRDNRHELEPYFVYSFLDILERNLEKATQKLMQSLDFKQFSDKTDAILVETKRQIPATSLFEIEQNIADINELCTEEIRTNSEVSKVKKKELELECTQLVKKLKKLDSQSVVQKLLERADIIFCTLSTAGSMPMRRLEKVDDLIVDEASAATEPEILIALQMGRSVKPKRLLLVGDPRQLPATVQSPIAEKYGLGRSLQERLMFAVKHPFTLLNVQYRMREEISKWPVTHFYDGKVENGENVVDLNYRSKTSFMDGKAYTWVDVSGRELKNKQLSTYNEEEAHAIVALLLDLRDQSHSLADWLQPDKVRVITFYQAQVDYIQMIFLKKHDLRNVTVSTVDSSQGCESDIVILSFVRGTSGHVGFLKDRRRLNVSLTRAKYQLICVGNLHALAALQEKPGNIALQDLATDARSRANMGLVRSLQERKQETEPIAAKLAATILHRKE